MKKSLREELERIHSISYGKKVILEDNFIDSLLNPVSGTTTKVGDDPKKADLLNNDPENLFKNLESIDKPVTQQAYGSMEWHKDVETIQIALQLLGYDLPIHGIDGLFGPETADAVRKFKQRNNILNEEAVPGVDEMVWNQESFGIDGGEIKPGLKWSGHDNHIHFGFSNPQMALSVIEKGQQLGLKLSENPYVTGDVSPVHVGNSFHYQVFDGEFNGKKLGKGLDVSGDKEKMDELFRFVAGNNYKPTQSTQPTNATLETVTPEMVKVMYSQLKQRGVTKEELAKYVDLILTGGSTEMTDFDLTNPVDVENYAKLCDAFINKRGANLLKINGRMLANAAVKAFRRYHKYVPPELALAQLTAEGGIGNPDPKSRPIRTKNPFNVGNTETRSNEMESVEKAIDDYYSLIARDYLGQSKKASDLLANFVNKEDQRYAKAESYEKMLGSLARQVNRLSKELRLSA